MRSQWIDKATGKVINLSNYSFSQMSGWGGYPQDMTKFEASDDNLYIKTRSYNKITAAPAIADIISLSTYIRASDYNGKSIKIKGYSTNAEARLSATVWANNFSEQLFNQDVPLGEILTVPAFDKETTNLSYLYLSIVIPRSSGKSFSMDDTGTIELLPDYPGALVSDGVDDYISEDGTLGEAVGTVLIHWKDIGLPNNHYLYNTSYEDTGRLYCYRYSTGSGMGAGIPTMAMTGKPIMYFTREPAVPEAPLNNNAGENNCPIFRLIFIKEQLDEYQLEFLTWKVGKEYRDWCKENGYDYAINEMLNN